VTAKFVEADPVDKITQVPHFFEQFTLSHCHAGGW